MTQGYQISRRIYTHPHMLLFVKPGDFLDLLQDRSLAKSKRLEISLAVHLLWSYDQSL